MGNATRLARKAGTLFGLTCVFLFSSQDPAFARACPRPEALRIDAHTSPFTQEKFLPGRDAPLISTGYFTVADRTVVWHMTEPFDVETIISPDGITQSIDGAPAETVAPGTAQFGARIATAMASLMRGQWDELNDIFKVVILPTSWKENWVVTLTPLDDRLAGVLGDITVRGCTDVETVLIARGEGDREIIRFGSVQQGDAQ